MTEEKKIETTTETEATVFVCGPSKCKHDWNGPFEEYPSGGTATCSKCGTRAIDEAAWY